MAATWRHARTLDLPIPDDIELPDRLGIEGIAPVMQEHLSSDPDQAAWLSERIREIETFVGKIPTIAVLVNDEVEVGPLAEALNECLKEINLAAVPFKEGKFVGNDRDVRVFNVRHNQGARIRGGVLRWP